MTPISRILAAAQDFPWPLQLGIAIPLAAALGWVGKWVFGQLKEERSATVAAQASKDALYDKIVDQVVPALGASTAATTEVLAVAKQLAAELAKEREERIRLEERSRRQT